MLLGRKQKKNVLVILAKKIFDLKKIIRTRKYLTLRIKRMRGSPHELAAGFAFGIAISFTPFIGIHALLALSFSWIVGGSMATAIIGTFVGNPWTFPIIWLLIYEVGELILSSWTLYEVKITNNALLNEITLLLEILKSIFITGNLEELKISLDSLILFPVMTVGCIPLVIISWVLSYFFFFRIIKNYQIKKKYKKN